MMPSLEHALERYAAAMRAADLLPEPAEPAGRDQCAPEPARRRARERSSEV